MGCGHEPSPADSHKKDSPFDSQTNSRVRLTVGTERTDAMSRNPNQSNCGYAPTCSIFLPGCCTPKRINVPNQGLAQCSLSCSLWHADVKNSQYFCIHQVSREPRRATQRSRRKLKRILTKRVSPQCANSWPTGNHAMIDVQSHIVLKPSGLDLGAIHYKQTSKITSAEASGREHTRDGSSTLNHHRIKTIPIPSATSPDDACPRKPQKFEARVSTKQVSTLPHTGVQVVNSTPRALG